MIEARSADAGIALTAAALLSRDEEDPAQDKLRKIARSAGQMKRLIEDLLDVTRIEAGRLAVAPAPRAAAELVAEAVDAARPAAAASRLDLDADVEEAKIAEAYAKSSGSKREAVTDLAWALINSTEFLYRH